ncbi:MAG: hypothetical protein ABSA40_05155 [Candidatus Dormibacteria bacterium]
MEQRKSRRSLRMALVLGAAVAGTALVGFGGLAVWNAYTENAGNSVAAGTLSHANQSSACVSSLGTVPVSSGTGWCSAVVTVTAINSTWTGTGAADTVKIDNTGTLSSTFAMSMPAAPTGSLCADLSLKVTDKNAATVYPTTVLTTAMAATALNNNAGTPSPTWTGGGTAGTGSGASGNTFTLTVAPYGSYASDSTDAGTSCTFNILFTQAA